MDVVYKVDSEFLNAWKRREDIEGDATSDVVRVLMVNGALAKITPLHPGTNDAELSRWFVVQGLNKPKAEKLAEALSKASGVVSAYAKPVDGPMNQPAGPRR